MIGTDLCRFNDWLHLMVRPYRVGLVCDKEIKGSQSYQAMIFNSS